MPLIVSVEVLSSGIARSFAGEMAVDERGRIPQQSLCAGMAAETLTVDRDRALTKYGDE
jgi:hypothetical protein